MQFGVLGSLDVVGDDGDAIALGGAQPRVLIARLLVAAGQVVSADALVDAIWEDDPPASASGTLQTYVSRLRRALEPGRSAGGRARLLVSEAHGYRLQVDADQVDWRRFERLADDARALLEAGDAAAARERLVEAIELWRGPALTEFRDLEWARAVATRLEERRVAAIEDRVDADLALGRHGAVTGELTELVAEHPLRERLRGQHALALYRSGRQADALRAIDDTRRTLRDELGVDPSRPIRELEDRILAHDPSLKLSAPASPRPAATDPPATAPMTAPVATDRTTGLIGRTAELQSLLDSFSETALHGTRFALVEGDPGIGKTRLLEVLAACATREGAITVWGRSHEGEGAPAFWPWIRPLRAFVDGLEPEERAEFVTPELGQLLTPVTDNGEGAILGANRFAIFDAIGGLLERAAAERPLVVLVDDLQWSDEASLGLIDFLAQRVAKAPILIAASMRELDIGRNDAVVGTVATMMRAPGTRRLRLRGLSRDETAALVAQTRHAPATDDVTATIYERAEGNPFFVTELTRLLETTSSPNVAAIPSGVRDVVRRRLARLPATTLEMLQLGAVVGRDVELTVLTRAAESDPETCLDELEPAIVQRLLTAVAGQPSVVRFAHALVREVVLEDVSPLRRARFHLRVADAIESTGGADNDSVEILAEHLWAAVPLGVERRASAALEHAADVATRRFAYESADDLLERALQLRSPSPGPDDDAAELNRITKLASLRRMRFGFDAGNRAVPFERAKELAQRTEQLPVYASLLWADWAAESTLCRFDVAQPFAEQLVVLAEDGDLMLGAIADHAVGILHWHLGDMEAADHHLTRCVDAVERDPRFHLALAQAIFENAHIVRSFQLHVRELRGALDDAASAFADIVKEESNPFAVLSITAFEAVGAMVAGEATRAEAAARRGLAADPNDAFPFYGGCCRAVLGWALSQRGAPDDGVAMMTAGLARYEATGARTVLAVYRAKLASALLAAGRADDALATIADAHREYEDSGERWVIPVVRLEEARIRLALGTVADEVVPLVADARDTARAQGSVLLARQAEKLGAELGLM